VSTQIDNNCIKALPGIASMVRMGEKVASKLDEVMWALKITPTCTHNLQNNWIERDDPGRLPAHDAASGGPPTFTY
jgi:hypothetical protein